MSFLANEFVVLNELLGQVCLATVNQICVIHEAMKGCKKKSKESLKDKIKHGKPSGLISNCGILNT